MQTQRMSQDDKLMPHPLHHDYIFVSVLLMGLVTSQTGYIDFQEITHTLPKSSKINVFLFFSIKVSRLEQILIHAKINIFLPFRACLHDEILTRKAEILLRLPGLSRSA